MPSIIELTGTKKGRLTVIEQAGKDKWGSILWKCICECDNETIVRGVELKKGTTKSCGCLLKHKITHHGMSKTRPYKIWQGMKTRCTNKKQPNYERYGNRMIDYDQKWETFEGFWEDMKPQYQDGLTIERIDNSKGYSKDNCTWVTPHEQNMNMRTNVFINYNGLDYTVDDIVKMTGFPRSMIYRRNSIGWTGDQIINTPPRSKFSNYNRYTDKEN